MGVSWRLDSTLGSGRQITLLYDHYHLGHPARADLCRRLRRILEARASYEKALALRCSFFLRATTVSILETNRTFPIFDEWKLVNPVRPRFFCLLVRLIPQRAGTLSEKRRHTCLQNCIMFRFCSTGNKHSVMGYAWSFRASLTCSTQWRCPMGSRQTLCDSRFLQWWIVGILLYLVASPTIVESSRPKPRPCDPNKELYPVSAGYPKYQPGTYPKCLGGTADGPNQGFCERIWCGDAVLHFSPDPIEGFAEDQLHVELY
jgi:hypothetical protein